MARRAALAVLGGLLLFAAFPPLDIGVLGFVAIAPLVWLARDIGTSGIRTGLGYGMLAGLVFMGPLIAWLLPFGVAAWGLLVLAQAVPIAAFVSLTAMVGERRLRPLLTVLLWAGLEAVRARWPLGGFAWGVLGYSQHDGGLALGAARTVGVHGVSLLLAGVAVAVEEVLAAARRVWRESRHAEVPGEALFGAMQRGLLTALALLCTAVILAGDVPGAAGPGDEPPRTIEVGIAQAGDTRSTSAAGVTRIDDGRIRRVAELARAATVPFEAAPPDLVVWPENSLDADVRSSGGAQVRALLEDAVAAVAPAPILAGEVRAGPRPGTATNDMTVFSTQGEGDSYRKRRPVPFGEYVPLRDLLGDLPPLQQIPSDIIPGDAAQVVEVAGARIGGVICFENTFGDLVAEQVLAGADLLVVSTNNSSFGDTPMSAQHVAFSALRAVESGRWVVHAGISGISAFIGPDGDVHQRTALFSQASPRMEVPLLTGRTPAVRLGPVVADVLVAGALAAAMLVLWLELRRRRQQSHPDG